MTAPLELLSQEFKLTPEEANYLMLAAFYGYSAKRVAMGLGWDEVTATARLARATELKSCRREYGVD